MTQQILINGLPQGCAHCRLGGQPGCVSGLQSGGTDRQL